MPDEHITAFTEVNSTSSVEGISKWARNSVAQIKRLMERWNSDPEFRRLVKENPSETLSKYNILADYDVVEPLLKEPYFTRTSSGDPQVKRYLEYVRQKFETRDAIRVRWAPQDPRLKAWRDRQIARGDKEFGLFQNQTLVHATFSFELSKGCSVGCWFCAVSAPKLTDLFLYDSQNQKIWREMLEAVKKIVGPGAYGFCYWATDPFDNPDYEKFLLDYWNIFGYLPQTTTALPMKDVARTRALLKFSKEHGGGGNRFSVLTLGLLNRIHQEFNAEELIHVECIALMNESARPKANAGRFRDHAIKDPSRYVAQMGKKQRFMRKSEEKDYSPSTIACVSGFLISMVDRTVKLISPCPADDQWPLGYIIFDEKTFQDPSDFEDVLQKMITEHMPDTLVEQDLVKLRSGQKSVAPNCEASNSAMTQYFHALGDLAKTGTHTAGKIALLLFYQYGVSPQTTMEHLNNFLEKGVLDSPQ